MGKYAMVIVSALIFSVITYSYGLRNALFLSNSRVVQSYSQNQAHNIAQAAAMIAINNLRNDSNTNFFPSENNIINYPSVENFEPWEEMHGSYNLRFMNQGNLLLVLTSTGLFEETIYSTNIGLIIGNSIWTPNFDQVLHAEDSITLGGNDYIGCEGILPCQVTINSIDQNAVKLGTQSKIKIDGDLFIGPGGHPNVVVNGNHSNVAGKITPLLRRLDYKMPNFPDYSDLNFLPGSSVYSNSIILNPEDYDRRHIPEILMTSGNNTLVFNTGNQDRELRVGNLQLSGQNRINVIGEGKLTVYVDYDIDMKGGSAMNELGDLNQLMLYYKGNQEVELYDETIDFGGNTFFNGNFFSEKAHVRLRGTAGIQGNVITGGSVIMRGDASAISRVVYAPLGSVTTDGNVKIRGAVISYSYVGSGNTTLIYDPDLDADLPELEVEGGGFDIVYWN